MSAERTALRLAMLGGPTSNQNPFLALQQRALAECGIYSSGEGSLRPSWLLRNRRRVQILHTHWPEAIFLRRAWSTSALRCGYFVLGLALARLLGCRIVWTAHNLAPHEPRHPLIARAGYFAQARLAHHVFITYPAERWELAARYGRRAAVHYACHGNYLDWYPDTITRQQARARLGLEGDQFVYLVFGLMRGYKGVPDAVRAFVRLARPNDRLLLAGSFRDPAVLGLVSRAATADERIIVHDRFVPDQEVQLYFRAADVALLPFQQVATSAGVLLALGFGLPVIGPRLGSLADVVDRSCGFLYRPGDAAGLVDCMIQARQAELGVMASAARRRAEAFTWVHSARIMAEVLRRPGPARAPSAAGRVGMTGRAQPGPER